MVLFSACKLHISDTVHHHWLLPQQLSRGEVSPAEPAAELPLPHPPGGGGGGGFQPGVPFYHPQDCQHGV